jgi:hypothetical protein
MIWWQILIIAGCVIMGTLAGILFVRIYYKKRLLKTELVPHGSGYVTPAHDGDRLSVLIDEYRANRKAYKTVADNHEKKIAARQDLPVTRMPPPSVQQEYPPVQPEKKKETPAVSKAVTPPKSPIFSEVLANIEIARDYRKNKPTPFSTNIWDSRNGDIDNLSVKTRSELLEIYTSMRVANNLVWLISEFGDSTQELTAKYGTLCNNIAERLSKVMEE